MPNVNINISGTPKRFVKQNAPAGAAAIVYTAPINQGREAIIDIIMANTTGASINFSLYLNGSTDADALMKAVSIMSNTTVQLSLFQVLNSAETIYALASATGLTLTISGLENV